jgi:prophage antirepressor-like protein
MGDIVKLEPKRKLNEQERAEVERFGRWLCHEVLPEIRKAGSYRGPVPEFLERKPFEEWFREWHELFDEQAANNGAA